MRVQPTQTESVLTVKRDNPKRMQRLSILAFLIFSPLFWGIGLCADMPDYSLLDDVLAGNVKNGFVDYDGINSDERFHRFVSQLDSAPRTATASDDQFFGFYINAYNALAISGILQGYSPKNAWGRRKFFKKLEFDVMGEKLTLEAIEHELLRPRGDPRIHFAIVCASMSCPRLLSRAYLPETIDLQLHDAAVKFVNDPTRNRFDAKRKIAFVSQIFDWFSEDFELAAGSVQKYIARFATDAEVQDLLRAEKFELRYEDYDWSLNGHLSDSRN